MTVMAPWPIFVRSFRPKGGLSLMMEYGPLSATKGAGTYPGPAPATTRRMPQDHHRQRWIRGLPRMRVAARRRSSRCRDRATPADWPALASPRRLSCRERPGCYIGLGTWVPRLDDHVKPVDSRVQVDKGGRTGEPELVGHALPFNLQFLAVNKDLRDHLHRAIACARQPYFLKAPVNRRARSGRSG